MMAMPELIPAEYIGPVCKHVCLLCGACSQCRDRDGICIDYTPQEEDPDA